MATTRTTWRHMAAIRVLIDHHVDASTADLLQAWSVAWDELADEWQQAIDDLLQTGDGEWPSRQQINRAARATKALERTATELTRLARESSSTITGRLSDLVAAAQEWEGKFAASQLPAATAVVAVTWKRMDAAAVDAIVARVTGQVEALTRILPAEQQAVMKRMLIRGVATGSGPREAARMMLERLQGVFDGGRRRAEVIARTEIVDAYRVSAQASRRTNADIVEGWRWTCSASPRTCGACIAMDGKVFDIDEPGPLGHQCCRCFAVPIVKSWKDLGFNIDEPAPVQSSARDWFDAQPDTVQADILGTERLRRIRSGDLTWDDIPQVRQTSGWRPSVVVRPLAA